MEAIQQRLSKLSDDELRAEVKSCGQKPIPITKTTRALVERRVAKYLWEQQGEGEREAPTSPSGQTKVDESAEDRVSVKPDPRQISRPQVDVVAVHNEHNLQTEPARVEAVNFFAVCLPSKNETGSGGRDETDSVSRGSSDVVVIFQDRREALNFTKKNKGARFKVFKTKEEASLFARSNQDLSTPKPSTEPTTSQPIAEKPVSSFRSVKPQDLVLLRKTIEGNDLARFKELVWSNPRYLINAGDSPTILQEGSRYNALHIAAKMNRPDISKLLLETVEDPAFILLMYPDDPEDTIVSRREYLVDLYLNSPDKGNGETPLHFASKFGNVEMTEILVNHPKCDKALKNKYHQTAIEIACSWCNLPGDRLTELKTSTLHLLQDQYYIPVYRADDNCTQPVIGEPWSPDLSEHRSSPLFAPRPVANSPIDSILSLQAFAGPMSPAEAERFRRDLRTPPSTEERKRVGRIKRADGEKGVERIGRDLASKMRVSWAEYWSFLDVFVDLTSPTGLQKLEDYLAESYNVMNEDETESTMQGPTCEQEQTLSSGKNGTDVTNLAGDYEKLKISGDESATDEADRAATPQTGTDKEQRPTHAETQSARESGSLAAVKCEPGMEPPSPDAAGSHKTFTEKMNRDNATNTAVIRQEKGIGDCATVKMRSEECRENGSQDSHMTGDPSVRQDTHPAESPSEVIQPAGRQSHGPDDEEVPVKNPGTDEGGTDSLKPRSQSEIPMQSGEHQGRDLPRHIDADSIPDVGSNADRETGSSSGTDGLRGRANCQASSPTDGGGAPVGGWEPPDVDTSSPEANHDRVGDGRRCFPPVADNGDRESEMLNTPKVLSSRRTERIVHRGDREKIGFILGPQPTKTDLHVWRALAEVEVPDKYHCVRHWRQMVSSVSAETRDRWPTPARCLLARVPYLYASQTPSPRHRIEFIGLFDGSPLGLRARHFSEPAHRGGRAVGQAGLDGTRARLFQE